MASSRRAALVTGAATGIGRAVAVALAKAGFDVAINYSRSKDAAKETQTKLAAVPRGDRTARPPILADFKTKIDALLTDEQKKIIVEKTPRRRANP